MACLLFAHERPVGTVCTHTLYVLQRLNTRSSRLVSNSAQSSSQIIVNKIDLFFFFFLNSAHIFPSSSPRHFPWLPQSTLLCLCPSRFILCQISLPRLPRAPSITACFFSPPLMFFSQCTEAMSQFLREFWCLDVSCPGPSRLSCSAGSMRSELRCLAAGQPSRPISVEAPLWSQVVGSAYREDQQRSVSPLHSLSLRVLYISSLFLSLLSVFCPLPFWHYPPSPSSMFFPSNHHISIYILSLSSFLSPTFPPCCVSCLIQTV